MKKIYTLAFILFLAVNSFAQIHITYENNALRAGDTRNLKQIEYQDQGQGGANQIWDFSKAKEIKTMTISQAENRKISNNKNLNLICDEGGKKNTFFEISKNKKMYWGLESGKAKIEFDEPIVDLKFPFGYQDKEGGVMSGMYTEGEKTSPIEGTYFTTADAWGTLILPDGNIYYNTLRVKVEKNYTQSFGNANFQIHTIRYQYFTKGVRYPVLIALESEIKTDCKCACNSKTQEAYYETPIYNFGETGKEILNENRDAIIENFEYVVSPNPFDNELQISFILNKDSKINIDIVDMNGKTIEKIVNKKLETGHYSYNINTSDIKAGQYAIRIQIDKNLYSTKLVKN